MKLGLAMPTFLLILFNPAINPVHPVYFQLGD
jgi:hypothetical protein